MNALVEIARPRGWGIGINLIDQPGGKMRPVTDVAQALRELRPAWWQSWTSEAPVDDAGWMPATESGKIDIPNWESDRIEILNWDAVDSRTWLILNEPESGLAGASLADPHIAAMVTCEAVEALRWHGLRFAWAAPNCNVNGANLEWLRVYARELMSHGVIPPYWGVHLYGAETRELRHQWARFRTWWNEAGDGRPVVLTECGAGSGATASQHVAVMQYIRGLLDETTVPVVGAAYFAAYQYEHGQRRYLGVLDTPALRDEWLRWR